MYDKYQETAGPTAYAAEAGFHAAQRGGYTGKREDWEKLGPSGREREPRGEGRGRDRPASRHGAGQGTHAGERHQARSRDQHADGPVAVPGEPARRLEAVGHDARWPQDPRPYVPEGRRVRREGRAVGELLRPPRRERAQAFEGVPRRAVERRPHLPVEADRRHRDEPEDDPGSPGHPREAGALRDPRVQQEDRGA